MDDKKAVARLEELPPGSSRPVMRDGQEVALFNVDGQIHALTHRCPHRSGPLAQGTVERVPDPADPGARPTLAVRCPIHGWVFELSTGRCLTRPSASVQTYPVTCEQGEISLGPAQGQLCGPSAPVVG